jgi:hypothetical protein
VKLAKIIRLDEQYFPDQVDKTYDINKMSAREQVDMVRRAGWLIQDIKDPVEAVQLAAVEKTASVFYL